MTPAAALPDIEALAGRLVGYRMPGGSYQIGPEAAAAVARLTAWDDPEPHPVFACIAALRALGISIEALCALCEFQLEDGPMLGEFGVSFERALQPATTYRTAATIVSLDRRHSTRLGVLDRLRFTVQIGLLDGTAVAEARFLWLLPRGGVAS